MFSLFWLFEQTKQLIEKLALHVGYIEKKKKFRLLNLIQIKQLFEKIVCFEQY